MKIEPCLYCGEGMKELCYGDAQCLGCGAIVEYCNIPLHNRLSRIVRAAEDWAVADAGYRTDGGCMEWANRLTDARRELRRAVEGGRADA